MIASNEMKPIKLKMHTQASFPPVSVLIPIHNAEQYLYEALESIRNQTFQNLEVLMILNGCTDSSLNICEFFAELDPRFHTFELENSNLVQALNFGVEIASGTWIARMDADDVSETTRIEQQMAFILENDDVRAVGTNALKITPNGEVKGLLEVGPRSREELRRFQQEGDPIHLCHPSVMFHAETVRTLGGYRQDYYPAEDLDLWTRMAKHHVVLRIDQELIRYRVHSESISTQKAWQQVCSEKRIRQSILLDAHRVRRKYPIPLKIRLARTELDAYSHYLQKVSERTDSSWPLTRELSLMFSVIIAPWRFRSAIVRRAHRLRNR